MSSNEINPDTSEAAASKGRPTPKRKDAQATRKDLLKGSKDSKADRKADRVRARESRANARAELIAGNPKFLPARDAGPIRAYVREFIDSRRTVGEYFVPMAFIVLLLGMVQNATLQKNVLVAWTLMLILVVVDTILVSIQLRTAIRRTFPEAPSTRGAIPYGIMRALQLRRLRIPKPIFKAGGKSISK
jgi:hypothetical protein